MRNDFAAQQLQVECNSAFHCNFASPGERMLGSSASPDTIPSATDRVWETRACSALRNAGCCSPFVFIVLILFSLPVSAAEKPDRVVIRLQGKASRTSLYGRIEDYSAGQLRMRLQFRDKVKTISEKEIVKVETSLVATHLRGLKALAAGEIPEARSALTKAIEDDPRKWVHQDIRALLVQCETRSGDRVAAIEQFSKLLRLDERTRHFHLIPLIWKNRLTNGQEQSAARRLIGGNHPVLRLLGASLLLCDEKNRLTGESELHLLSTGSDLPLNVKRLANCQLWRNRLREGAIRDGELRGWQTRIRLMPEDLRAGPYFLLGKAHIGRREYDDAALSFLRVPINHDDNYRLSATACFEAAEATSNAGRRIAADSIYREVATRYAESPEAELANRLLQKRK